MNCPDCNKKSRVINTGSDGEVTYRVYKCPDCGRKFVTSEMLDSDSMTADLWRIRDRNKIIKRKGGENMKKFIG